MIAIKIKELSKSYGDLKAVDNLSLEIKENTVFGLLGPNGAGKTTTIRMLTGLSKPDSGSIEISGQAVKFGESSHTGLFGYLPEQPSFYGWMTGTEFLNLTSDLFGFSRETKKKRTRGLLELTGLTEAGEKKISTYSNGMKQRLGIAQALINDPKVLILDEPVSALDPIGRKEVLEVIQKLSTSKTIIMSTHILADVDRVCDEVAILDRGCLLVHSSLSELKTRYASPMLEITFSTDPELLVPQLINQPWVRRIVENGNQLRIWLEKPEVVEENIPLKLLIESGIGVTSYGLALPETEDLFLEILGEAN